MYGEIRQAIIDLISSSEILKVQAAYRTDRSDIDGYPVALVFPSEQTAEYHQTSPASNKETYVFTVRVIYPFVEGQEDADLALEEAVDELIAAFRVRGCLGSAADWVAPVPSVWGYQDRGNGTVRVAELTIQAIKYVEQ